MSFKMLLVLVILGITACTSELRGIGLPLATEAIEDFVHEDWGTLYRFQQDGLWGYKDAYGNIVISPYYLAASQFSEGLAGIRGIPNNEDFFGFIDLEGNLVISLPSIVSILQGFSEGFAIIGEREWDWGNETPLGIHSRGPVVFIDRTGQNVFNQEFEVATNFKEGFAIVALYRGNKFFIDRTGQNAFGMEFEWANDFDEYGYARVQLLNGNWRYINRSGRIVRNRR